MNLKLFSICLMILGFSDFVKAEEVSGNVKIVGSNVNSEITLHNLDAPNPVKLCRGDNSKKITRLSGIKIKATGSWKDGPSGKDKCFDVFSFTITDMGSGRAPLVGLLEGSDKSFTVKDDNNVIYRLDRVSKGLKKLVGKRVIIDVKPIQGLKDSSDKTWRVVSYSEFPQ